MKRKAYSRAERKEMILNAFYSRVGDGHDPDMTAYQMAKELGVNSAQHVRSILEEMVSEGTLTFVVRQHRKNVTKKVYAPKLLIDYIFEQQVHAPKIRINGKVV